MFRRGFRDFDEDPFFSGFRERHDDQQRLFEDQFGSFGLPALRGVEDRHHSEEHVEDRHRQDDRRGREVAPRNLFGDMFSHMNAMMDNMNRGFADMERNMEDLSSDPNSYMFSQSMVSSYRNEPHGEPKYYQATTSTSKAPGGIKQTTKTLKDSESGEQKMAIGHHIGDKGHVVERRANRKTNAKEEHQNYIGMDENDHESFHREWKDKSGRLIDLGAGRSLDERRHRGRGERAGRSLDDRRDRKPDRAAGRAIEDRRYRDLDPRPMEGHRPHAAHGGKRPPRDDATDYKDTKTESREPKHDKPKKESNGREPKHDKRNTKFRDY